MASSDLITIDRVKNKIEAEDYRIRIRPNKAHKRLEVQQLAPRLLRLAVHRSFLQCLIAQYTEEERLVESMEALWFESMISNASDDEANEE